MQLSAQAVLHVMKSELSCVRTHAVVDELQTRYRGALDGGASILADARVRAIRELRIEYLLAADLLALTTEPAPSAATPSNSAADSLLARCREAARFSRLRQTELWLLALTAQLTDEPVMSRALWQQCFDLAHARNEATLMDAASAAIAELTPAQVEEADSGSPRLQVDDDTRRIVWRDREFSFDARPLLFRLLRELVQAHQDDDGAVVPRDELIARVWPGSRFIGDSGINRLHVALSTIRSTGLGPVIERADGGYRIARGVDVELNGHRTSAPAPAAHVPPAVATRPGPAPGEVLPLMPPASEVRRLIALVQRAARKRAGPEQATALRALRAEFDSLLGLLEAIRHDRPAVAWRLVSVLHRIQTLTALPWAAGDWVLAIARALEQQCRSWAALEARAVLAHLLRGTLPSLAALVAEDVQARARTLTNPWYRGRVEIGLAAAVPAQRVEHDERAVEALSKLDDRESRILAGLALCRLATTSRPTSGSGRTRWELLHDARDRLRLADAPGLVPFVDYTLGSLAYTEGDISTALDCLRRAVAAPLWSASQWARIHAQANLSYLRLLSGDAVPPIVFCAHAEELMQLQQPGPAALFLRIAAETALTRPHPPAGDDGDAPEERTLVLAAQVAAEELGGPALLARARLVVALWEFLQGVRVPGGPADASATPPPDGSTARAVLEQLSSVSSRVDLHGLHDAEWVVRELVRIASMPSLVRAVEAMTELANALHDRPAHPLISAAASACFHDGVTPSAIGMRVHPAGAWIDVGDGKRVDLRRSPSMQRLVTALLVARLRGAEGADIEELRECLAGASPTRNAVHAVVRRLRKAGLDAIRHEASAGYCLPGVRLIIAHEPSA